MKKETGFPSPAKGYEEERIDLNQLLITNPPATFFMRMQGNQLSEKSVEQNDILVVDRSRPPVPGNLVVFRQNEEFLCRELIRYGGSFAFFCQNESIIPIYEETEIFGVVTGVVRKL